MRHKDKKHTKLREVICCECSKKYFDYIPPSELKKNKVCSRECFSFHMRRVRQKRTFIKKCPICSKEFRSQIKRETFFCSRKCWIKSRIGTPHMSNEAKIKLSKQRLGKDNPMFGRTHSDEYKARLSLIMREARVEV